MPSGPADPARVGARRAAPLRRRIGPWLGPWLGLQLIRLGETIAGPRTADHCGRGPARL